jgi:protein-tyrosine phosphatase
VGGEKISVLFVCLGNICRSPLAEAVFRAVVKEAGLADRIRIDSAGTSGFHEGDPPDRRTTEVAARRGVRVWGRSRPVTREDLTDFDYLVAMDRENHRNLERLVAGAGLGAGEGPELRLLREFDPEATDRDREVPDPYYGGTDGFDRVHDMVERAARGLLDHLREQHGL